jgi:hypothetical protein
MEMGPTRPPRVAAPPPPPGKYGNPMSDLPSSHSDAESRRRSARRTAAVVGGIAVAIYVVFILSGVMGR